MAVCPVCGVEGCMGETPAPRYIIDMVEVVSMALWTANRRLYLDRNGKVVEANDPTKASLLVPAGGTLPMERAEALGLLAPPAPPVAEKAKAEPLANKAKAEPLANKGKG